MLKSHKEILADLGSDAAIQLCVAEGTLHRVDRGMYSDRVYVPLLETARKRYPEAVVTMDSAFFYAGLTDLIPEELHLATRRGASRIADPRIAQHFTPDELLEIGVCEKVYNGVFFRTYDLERLTIELVRMRSRIPYDLYKDVVKALRKREDAMYPARLEEYAARFPRRELILDTVRKEIL